ncbi:vWA domain-containing protein [Frigidibacter sp. ROC022]|uniref:vWA domain-containing protein n=1 Tax=Frigidibacter sp. ROC022 TaxID=2971796 RepID=UPI00215AF7D7|nr:VWA domain-containing protein [Frigidibacter sp. ROC022]MCR8725077.1 VWA domain-containing protein [Frigidibacter sp. ROC022]
MSMITRFAARDPGVTARVTGFIGHLRDHGFAIGVAEAQAAVQALSHVQAGDIGEAQLALKSVCTGNEDEAKRFAMLFDSYWRTAGRVREKIDKSGRDRPRNTRSSQALEGQKSAGAGKIDSPGRGDGEAETGGEGRLIASGVQNLMKKDMRELVSPQDIRQAEEVARRLAAAMRDRRSRRRTAAQKGARIDFRKVVRQSLSTGGEPMLLPRKRRPDRPVQITALCDVSGSMTVYSRVFLAFLAGLIRAETTADAYLFHTRLVRITGALRDDDPLRALNRLTLMADGFGGGSKIGTNLQVFARTYARRFVSGRSVVIILSDGYDTDPPAGLAGALREIKRRGCRIVWLNPLKGWKNYAPVAAGMAAALPFLDVFAAANTLESLAALEGELAWV